MPCGKGEMHQLACALFYLFRGHAVVNDYKGVGALKSSGNDLQPNFHLVLLANFHIHPRIVFPKSEEGLLVRKRWADEHNEVEFATERARELVNHKTCFA